MSRRLSPEGETRIVNVADLSPVDEAFIDLPVIGGEPITWLQHSGLPENPLERRVKRPRLSRYRAAWRSVSDARTSTAIISHLPRMSAAVGRVAQLRKVDTPHLAFSFNFTTLPSARGIAWFRRSLADIDQFCTYTNFEADLYSDVFAIARERFQPVRWTQSTPVLAAIDPALVPGTPFVVAVGGEGRDFALLAATARALPNIAFVVIARPSAALADPPPNMTVLFNIPLATCWGIASRAAALLVPLRDAGTCCGHITLVSGRMLGLPIITTASLGTDEYTRGFAGTTVISPGDVDGWVDAIRHVIEDPGATREIAKPDMVAAETLYDRRQWATYVEQFMKRISG